jgi:hypothetical protein
MFDLKTDPLLWNWAFSSCYIAAAIVAQLAIMVISSTLRASEQISHPLSDPTSEGRKYPSWPELWIEFRFVFCGYFTPHMDRLIPLCIGVTELFIYPTAMHYGAWNYIGAWIALKTLPHWTRWTRKRAVFNRYLLGNALVLIASYLIAVCILGPMPAIGVGAR